jgi:predicted glycoside hydrolase/deacetylase ChbG (UPF0249 family)
MEVHRMKRLIINADDFGLSDGVNRGIAYSMLTGVVCTTSVLPCDLQGLRNASKWIHVLKNRIGVHLQLTGGVPCAPPELVKSLVSSAERFPGSTHEMKVPNKHDIVMEWRCQVDRVLDCGFQPTHIDTHHYTHMLPVVFDAYCDIARLYKLPARTRSPHMTSRLRSAGVRCADMCEVQWYNRELDLPGITRLIEEGFRCLHSDGTLEVMCHPGYCDAELKHKSSYCEQRDIELAVLCNPELARYCKREAIVLVNRATDKDAEWC